MWGSNKRFVLFYPFIVSVFVQHGRTKAVTQLFTSLFMFIHLPLNHFVPPPCLHLIMHYYAFVITSLTRLAYFLSHDYLSYMYINSLGFLFIFCLILCRRSNAQNVRLYYSYWQYTNLFIFRFKFT